MNVLRAVFKKHVRLLIVVGLLSAACLLLIFARIVISGTTYNGSVYYWFLNWNLLLGVTPLFFALLALEVRSVKLSIAFGLTALVFLPNSFYLVTDFIHLNEFQASNEHIGVNNMYSSPPAYVGPGILFDSVLLFVYSIVAAFAGSAAIEAMRLRLKKHFSEFTTWSFITLGIILSAIAIYLGRVLRWNSWDFVANPIKLFSDSAALFVHPIENSQAWEITGLFFVVIFTCYGIYRGSKHL